MKKIFYALAGYAVYKWWNKRSAEQAAAGSPPARR